jgi:hypothetical protein
MAQLLGHLNHIIVIVLTKTTSIFRTKASEALAVLIGHLTPLQVTIPLISASLCRLLHKPGQHLGGWQHGAVGGYPAGHLPDCVLLLKIKQVRSPRPGSDQQPGGSAPASMWCAVYAWPHSPPHKFKPS